MRKLIISIATAGGLGRLPGAPGTLGSVLGVALWAALARGDSVVLLLGWAATLVIAIWAGGRAQAWLGLDDGRIVIDEVAGQLTALLLLPVRLDVALVGFGLFRLFDIWKPPPVSWAESLAGGAGVTGDDLVAGVLANLAGQLLWRVALPEGAF